MSLSKKTGKPCVDLVRVGCMDCCVPLRLCAVLCVIGTVLFGTVGNKLLEIEFTAVTNVLKVVSK